MEEHGRNAHGHHQVVEVHLPPTGEEPDDATMVSAVTFESNALFVPTLYPSSENVDNASRLPQVQEHVVPTAGHGNNKSKYMEELDPSESQMDSGELLQDIITKRIEADAATADRLMSSHTQSSRHQCIAASGVVAKNTDDKASIMSSSQKTQEKSTATNTSVGIPADTTPDNAANSNNKQALMDKSKLLLPGSHHIRESIVAARAINIVASADEEIGGQQQHWHGDTSKEGCPSNNGNTEGITEGIALGMKAAPYLDAAAPKAEQESQQQPTTLNQQSYHQDGTTTKGINPVEPDHPRIIPDPTAQQRQNAMIHPGAFAFGQNSSGHAIINDLSWNGDASSARLERPAEGQRSANDDGLVEAMPVHDLEMMDRQQAVAVTGDDGGGGDGTTRTWSSRKIPLMWECAVFLLLTVIGILIGSICGAGLCKGNGDHDDKDQAQSLPVLTERDITQAPQMRSAIENILGVGYFDEVEVSEYIDDNDLRDFFLETRQRSLNWIVNEDPLQLVYDSNNLVQRFLLAHLYFQTTRHRRWNDCNPPAKTASSFSYCHFDSVDGITKGLGDPWLSSSHECNWAGIFCEDKQIAQLRLWWLALNGPLPWEIGKLTSLTRLDLRYNELTGVLPTKLLLGENNSALETLSVSHNEFSGTIPTEWFVNQQLNGTWGLKQLSLRSNRLTGSIPSELGLLPMEILILSNNTLTGTLPLELFHLGSIEYLHLDENQLSGTLPTEVGLLTSLDTLYLTSNPISGSLPSEVGLATPLKVFNVSYTNMQGTVPEGFYLGLTSIIVAGLNDCNFSGTISSSMALLTDLQWLDLANNNFHGTIPSNIESMTILEQLLLNGNDFTGTVPDSLCQNYQTLHGPGHSFFQLVADCFADPETGSAEIDCTDSCCTSCCDEAGFCHDT